MEHEEAATAIATAELPEAPPAKTPALRRRLTVLVSILIALCVAWLAGAVDNERMQQQLREAAREKIAMDEAYAKRAGMVGMEIVVTATREFVLFGPATGKIHVFFKKPGGGYEGIEYHYVQRDGGWIMTDSASCAGQDCLREARKAFGDE